MYLTCQEVACYQEPWLLVVVATNRKDVLDAALIGPGRNDKTIELGFPTQEEMEVRSTSKSGNVRLR